MKKNERLTHLSQNLRRNATKEENALWYQYLRRYPVQFRRQCVLEPYVVDFYCAKALLVVELDGSQHYEAAGMERDRQRTQYLESLGIKVLRFSNVDVNDHLSGICQAIDLTVKARMAAGPEGSGRKIYTTLHQGVSAPHPPLSGAPSPKGEGFQNGGNMSNFEFSVPCLFGLEGIAGDELRRLNIENVRVENGRVLFSGD